MIRNFFKKQKSFQLRRETKVKISHIANALKEMQIGSLLEVGCNAGEIVRAMGANGIFAVGVDKQLDFRGIDYRYEKAFFGNVEMNAEMIDKLPKFDAILLLSVHHQIIEQHGDEVARTYVSKLANRSNKIFLIEFAALNRKFGKLNGNLFEDNNENSVKQYAQEWLNSALPDFSCKFVSKIPQCSSEPFRYLFKCTK
ncbi:MAG: hypothetical protein ABFD79_02975 [Phycisphaerales bacterium]